MTARHYRRNPDGTREEVQHDTAEQALESVRFGGLVNQPPDDSEARKALDEAEDFADAVGCLANLYDVPVTNKKVGGESK